MTTYYRLEQQIIDWHNARNLIEGSTDHQQFEKAVRRSRRAASEHRTQSRL